MKKRLLGSLLAALFVMSLMAPAALAEVNGVAVFQGVADVGNDFADGCDKDGGTATGVGIGLLPSGTHTWSLETSFDFAGTGQDGAGVYRGLFEVCGWMDDTVDQVGGAACATTKGYYGRGYAHAANVLDPADDFGLKIYNIGWKAAAGAVLTITGNYQVLQDPADPHGAKKTKQEGTILAVVTAAPTDPPEELPCVLTTAEDFTVVGEAELVQDGGTLPEKAAGKPCATKDDSPNTICAPGPGPKP